MKTILQDYIRHSVNVYHEPTRKGTPPGEKVGLSKVKFHAMLLCALTNRKQRLISNDVGVSHGLLRKWRTENEFLRYTELHQTEFVEKVKQYLREKWGVSKVEPGKFVQEKKETNAIVKLIDAATLFNHTGYEHFC